MAAAFVWPADLTALRQAEAVDVSSTSLVVSEPEGSSTVQFSLTTAPTATVAITLSASNGQCSVSPGTLVLDAGNWSTGATATVTAVDDAIDDGDETCAIQTGLTVSNDPMYQGLFVADITVTVKDDDQAGVAVASTGLTVAEPDGSDTFVIRLDSQPLGEVTVSLTASNNQCSVSPAAVDLDAGDWSTGETVTVTAVNDDIDDGDVLCTIQTGTTASDDPKYQGLTVADVPVSVQDDDQVGVTVMPTEFTIAEPDGSGTFVVSLTSEPVAEVTVSLAASNGQCSVLPAALVLDSGNWSAGATATVTAVNDDVDDDTTTCMIVTGSTASDDPMYQGLEVTDVTVTVQDDDQAGVTVTPTSLTVSEPDGSGTFVVRLTSEPLADVTVALAASNSQCSVSPASVVLDDANWSTGATATVTAVNDAIDDDTMTCMIVTGAAVSTDNKYQGLDVTDVTVTVQDDDQAGVTVTPTSLTVSEPFGAATFVVRLTSQPLNGVWIPLSASNDECSIPMTYVWLTSANWSTGVTVTVTAVDDDIDDDTTTCIIQTDSATSSDPKYQGLTVADVTVSVEDDDQAGVTVTPTSLTVSEPSGSATFVVRLTSEPLAGVTVSLAASNGQCSVSPASVVLNDDNWSTGATATVTAVNDAIDDDTMTCMIVTGAAVSTDNKYQGLDVSDVTVAVQDDDQAGVTVTPTSLTVSEPSGSATFVVRLTSQPLAGVTVSLAASNNQCSVSPAALVLDDDNWSTGATATVTAVNDAIDDDAMTCVIQTGFTVSSDNKYQGLPVADVTVTVQDDDQAGVTVTPTSLTVSEPSGSATFVIRLTSQPLNGVFIPLSTSNTQCSVSTGSGSYVWLTSTNWSTGETITVTAVDDLEADGSTTCMVLIGQTVSDDTKYRGIDPQDVTVTVQDNDVASVLVSPTSLAVSEPSGTATFNIRLTSQPRAQVSVPLSPSNDECSVPSTVYLNLGNWQSGVTVTVSAVNDDIADGDQSCVIRTGPTNSSDSHYRGLDPENVDVLVSDDDEASVLVAPTSLTIAEPSGSGTFVIRLASQPEAQVSVPLSTFNNQCSVSPATILLDAGNWQSGATATVTAVNDAIDDGNLTCMVQTGTTESEDANYDNRNPADVTVTVLDDDQAGIVVNPTSLTVSEPDGSDTFVVRLTSEPMNSVYIPLSTTSGECSISESLVRIAPDEWSTGKTITVMAVDDLEADGDQTCLVEVRPSNSDDALYDGINPADVTVTVQDDDQAGITVTPTSLTVSEPDGSDTFVVRLTSRPLADVSLSLTASNSQCSISPAQLVLDDDNWESGETATVTAVDDDIDDDTLTCAIQTSSTTSSDNKYHGLVVADVTVSVQDDDQAGVTVAPGSLTVSEPDGSDTFVVRLNSQPLAGVTVSLAASNDQCSVSANSVRLDAGTWSTGETVTVSAVNDALIDGTMTCAIQTGPAVSLDPKYQGLAVADVTVTVHDDDQAGVTVTPTSLTVSEPDGAASTLIRLTSEPTATVSIGLAPSNEECDVSTRSVLLGAGNWHTGVTVAVTARDDHVRDGSQTCVVHSSITSSSDRRYEGLEVDDITVTVLDDERLWLTYLPMTLRCWPLVPYAPVLHAIDNPYGLGSFRVSWDPAAVAKSYVLEEAKGSTFAPVWETYSTSATSQQISGRGAARYYYRVKGLDDCSMGVWSNVRQVDVLWEAEPNGVVSEANGPLVSGLTYHGTFPNEADEQDYYYFYLPVARPVELLLTNIPAGQDYNLVLRNGKDLSIEAYDPKTGNANERLDTGVLQPGIYYIQVYHYSGLGSNQPYDLRVVYE